MLGMVSASGCTWVTHHSPTASLCLQGHHHGLDLNLPMHALVSGDYQNHGNGGCKKGNRNSGGAHCGVHTAPGTQAEPNNSSHSDHGTVKTSLTIRTISEQET